MLILRTFIELSCSTWSYLDCFWGISLIWKGSVLLYLICNKWTICWINRFVNSKCNIEPILFGIYRSCINITNKVFCVSYRELLREQQIEFIANKKEDNNSCDKCKQSPNACFIWFFPFVCKLYFLSIHIDVFKLFI